MSHPYTENIFIKTTEKISVDSYNYKIVETIATKWANTPSGIRYVLIGYAVISIGCYAMYNYNEGKRALLNYRENTTKLYRNEWTAIKNSIYYTNNFFSALFFPWSITEKIMPNIILFLNPPDIKKE